MNSSPSRTARQAKGIPVVEAAQALRISPRYLLDLERTGGWTLDLAARAGDLYGCSYNDFYRPSTGGNARGGAAAQRAAACRGRRPRRTPPAAVAEGVGR